MQNSYNNFTDQERHSFSVEGSQTINEPSESNPAISDTNSEKKYIVISNEQRKQLIYMVMTNSINIKNASKKLKVGYSAACKIIKEYVTMGKTEKFRQGGSARTVLSEAVLNTIENIVEANPDYTLKQIKNSVAEIIPNNSISLSTVNNALQFLLITVKKAHRELNKVNLPDYIEKRREYAIWFNSTYGLDCSNVIFVDESPFNLHMQRMQARSKKGTRANLAIPTVRGRNASLIASLGIEQMHTSKIIANRTVNSAIFNEYINDLCRNLRDVKHRSNVCIIMDNARIHKKQDLEEITNQYGFRIKFLSPYSYMLNPIENAFSKIKLIVREELRSGIGGDLEDIIMCALGRITMADCNGYFRHMNQNITNCAAGLPYHHQ